MFTKLGRQDPVPAGRAPRVKNPDAPKKPLTPFFIFLKKRRMELAGSEELKQNVTSFTSMIGNEWNSMTQEQKMQYKHDAELGKAVLAKANQLNGVTNEQQE